MPRRLELLVFCFFFRPSSHSVRSASRASWMGWHSTSLGKNYGRQEPITHGRLGRRRSPSSQLDCGAKIKYFGGLLLNVRVVTRYMGSGISGFFRGGIRDHNLGIWDHNPWDRDQ